MPSECHVCKRTPFDAALMRVNELGVVPAVWACQDHTDIPLDPITAIIQEDNERRRAAKVGAPPEAE
jgi:hypothetical protein